MNPSFALRPAHPARASLASRLRLAARRCTGAALLSLALPATGVAAPSSTCADHLAEAAQVSGLPEPLVASVLDIESRGRSAAVSSAGAMGCMQIMPATWASLTARYGLGNDAFDPRANMIGGALYLRQMVDRYGLPGAFAAYNAGPGRYEAWRDHGRRLPTETINYVARLAPSARTISATQMPVNVASVAPDWKQSLIFVSLTHRQSSPSTSANTGAVLAATVVDSSFDVGDRNSPQIPPPVPQKLRSDGLFAVATRP